MRRRRQPIRRAKPKPYVSLFGFRNGLFGRFETDLGMSAVAKRFLSRCAAAAKRHARFDGKLVSVAVDQFHFALHDVRTVLDCLDCYLSHGRTLKHQIRNPKRQVNFKLQASNRGDGIPSSHVERSETSLVFVCRRIQRFFASLRMTGTQSVVEATVSAACLLNGRLRISASTTSVFQVT